jgi:hypothetical protein
MLPSTTDMKRSLERHHLQARWYHESLEKEQAEGLPREMYREMEWLVRRALEKGSVMDIHPDIYDRFNGHFNFVLNKLVEDGNKISKDKYVVLHASPPDVFGVAKLEVAIVARNE